MDSLRHFALGCCLLCALAGVVRIFWPENGTKPVINTVLLLYIVASVVPMARGADWPALAAELRGWARGGAEVPEYRAYADALAEQASAAALEALLAEQGITAVVTIEDGHCTVILSDPADAAAAKALLREACGEMPFTLRQGGEAG